MTVVTTYAVELGLLDIAIRLAVPVALMVGLTVVSVRMGRKGLWVALLWGLFAVILSAMSYLMLAPEPSVSEVSARILIVAIATYAGVAAVMAATVFAVTLAVVGHKLRFGAMTSPVAAIAVLCGFAIVGTGGDSLAQDADPFADVRPATGAVGVVMPENFAPIEWLNRHYTERVTLYAHLAPMNGGVAFVGDSITDAGRWADAWPGLTVRNFGIGGDTVWGLAARAHQVTAARPDRIFLLIGTNDLGWEKTPEEIASGVAELLDQWAADLPDTQVFVQSVLPRQPEFHERIVELNARLRDVAGEKGATFVDLHSAFVVEGGRLDPAVTLDDLHLSGEGYARWRGLIDACVTGAGECAQ